MDKIKAHIDEQVQFNRMKNLLCEEPLSDFGFSPSTVAFVKGNLATLQNMGAQQEELLDHLVNKAVEALCRANQFYDFNSFDRAALRKIYGKLLAGIRNLPEDHKEEGLRVLAKRHYRALQAWLRSSNPFARTLYAATEPHLQQEVVCSEYSAPTQLSLLGIANAAGLVEPILDLGCGQQAFLVKHLRELGLQAYGVDRNVTATASLFQGDWFEWDLAEGSWGTIISNLGYSNHFQHHHLRAGGDYTRYALRYMELLQSLKGGGAFYYAPDLPFMEQHLDAGRYRVHKSAVEGTTYSATKVVRL